jgi:6-phosphogluconolactonase
LNLRRFDSVTELTIGTADAIVRIVEKLGGGVVSLSGGTTPPPIYALLGEGERRERLAAHRVIWVVGDERFVPQDDARSNAGMIRRTLFANGIAASHSFLDFRTDRGEPDAVAVDFEERWRELKIERIDCCILGVGDDGHTASLFPGTDVLMVEDRVASAVWVEKLNMWRLTTTLPVIRGASNRFVLAAGDSKREILRRVDAGDEMPIVAATRGEGETWWFVDRAAAPEI